MIELGVNIDHVATIRQARRTYEPDPVWAAVEAHLATSPDAGEVSGRYFEATRWTRPSPLALDADVQERFWEMGLDLVGVDRW